jgi:hypothetical protein
MSGFAPGDVVVRVKYDGPDPSGNSTKRVPIAPGEAPPIGRTFRVTKVVTSNGEVGLVVPGYPSRHPTKAWHHLLFRKIDKSDEGFAAWMRSLRPIKVKGRVEA